MPFEFIQQEISGLILIKPRSFPDDRGFFLESYKYSEFAANGIAEKFVQDNHSRSSKGILRGLHYQLNPMSQGKLVRCTRGCIIDIAVDIRKDSPDFGKWIKVELSEENKNMFYIPAGFAHGFVVHSEIAELLYKTTEEYAPLYDRGIKWDDPDLNIDWNIDFEPLVSEKDKNLPYIKQADMNFNMESKV